MKSKIISLFIIFLFSKCSSVKNEKNNDWIEDYKMNAFYNCLEESYRNDSIFKLIEEEDVLFQYNDNFNIVVLKSINENAKKIAKKAKEPIYKVDDYKSGQKEFLKNCLLYYKSKELDSIANSEYKKMLKNQ